MTVKEIIKQRKKNHNALLELLFKCVTPIKLKAVKK